MSVENNEPIYIERLEMGNVLCFKGTHEVSFLRNDGKPALFTVILGNNNTGKTTILKMLSAWEKTTDNKYIVSFLRVLGYYQSQDKWVTDYASFSLKISTQEDTFSTQIRPEHKNFMSFNRHSLDRNFYIDAYGINRKTGSQNAVDYDIDKIENCTKTLFEDKTEPYLLNTESWLTGLAAASNFNAKAKDQLEKAKEIVNQIFAAAEGLSEGENVIYFSASDTGDFQVQFRTALGDKVRLSNLGSGYQSLLTWVLDLAYRMFRRYPSSDNPLGEPAVVLVDEIDLHLHPEWQRRLIKFLRDLFPKTQFIVTAHSPVVVQSADNLNVIVLRKNEATQSVEIIDANDEFNTNTFEGWTLQEILQDLMLEKSENLYSETYNKWRTAFKQAILRNDVTKAEEAFAALEKIAKKDSGELERWRIQLSALAHLKK